MTKASVDTNSEGGNCFKTISRILKIARRFHLSNASRSAMYIPATPEVTITLLRGLGGLYTSKEGEMQITTWLLSRIFPGTTHLRYSQKIIARSGWTSRWALRSMEFQDALRQDEVHGERAFRFGFRECVRLITKWMGLVHTGLLSPAGGHHSLLRRVILYFSFFVETTGGRDSPFSSFPSALYSSGSACAHFWGKHYWMKHFEPWILMMCGQPFYAQSGNSTTNAKHSGHI